MHSKTNGLHIIKRPQRKLCKQPDVQINQPSQERNGAREQENPGKNQHQLKKPNITKPMEKFIIRNQLVHEHTKQAQALLCHIRHRQLLPFHIRKPTNKRNQPRQEIHQYHQPRH